MRLKRRTTRRGRIEIIPMIDTILILLVFYMTFSSFTQKEKRMNVKMPLIGRTMKAIPNDTPNLVLHVYDKNKIVVGGNQHDMVTLRETMMGFASIGQEMTVVIEAEPDTLYEDVIGALDACAAANLKKVALRPLANSSDVDAHHAIPTSTPTSIVNRPMHITPPTSTCRCSQPEDHATGCRRWSQVNRPNSQ